MEILEVLCNYASPAKKYQPSSVAVSFCTEVLVEALGSVTTIDSDCVKRIMPFIVSGLQPSLSGCQDHKLQSVDMFPKRVVEILRARSDLAGVLSSLAKEFNIDQFLTVLLDSLADYSSDELCCRYLISILDTVPLNHLVDWVVLKVLFSCMKLSEKLSNSSPESGQWAKQILVIINKKYPSELHAAVGKFFKDKKVRTKKEDSVVENLCRWKNGFVTGILRFKNLVYIRPSKGRSSLCCTLWLGQICHFGSR